MIFTTDIDMEYVLLQSRISGGHYLNDLRKRVPYDSTLRLTKDEVESSDDLSRAIQKNLVEVKKKLSSQNPRQPESRGNQVSQAESSESQVQSQAESQADATAEVVEKHEDRENEEIEELKRLNRRLMMTIQNLIQQQESLSSKQEDLMRKMEDFVDQPPAQTIQAVDVSDQDTSGSKETVDGDYDTFVPNQIRSGEAETSGQLEMEEEEEKSGDRLDKAAEMMNKLQSGDDED